MLRQSSVFALALISGAATAGPLANTVNGLLGVGGPATASAIAPISGPLTSTISTLETAAAPVTSAAPLPGLAPSKDGAIPLNELLANGTLPLGANVLEDGSVPNTGYDDVLRLSILDLLLTDDGGRILTYGDGPGDLPGLIDIYQDALVPLVGVAPLGTPDLLGQNPPNGFGLLKVALFGGDNVGNAGFGAPGPSSGIGVALFSGNVTGNGTIGIGVGNGSVTGNGTAIGIAALSDNRDGNSGQGGQLGVGVLNQGDALHICGSGTCFGTQTVRDGVGNMATAPNNPLITGNIGGGDNQGNGTGVISAAVLSGNNSGNGGVIALSVASGNNTGQGQLVGGAVVAGDNSATGPIAAGVLTGDNSALTNSGNDPTGFFGAPGGVLAAGVLTGNNSVKSSAPATDTTAAPYLAAGALTGNNSVNDTNSFLNAAALTGPGGPAPVAGPGPSVDPGANPDDNGESAQNTGDSELCALLAKDNRGRVKGKLREKAHCAKLKTPKA